MAFTKKAWKDDPSTDTPLSAAALIDLEDRLSDYTDTVAATKASSTDLSTHASDTTSVHGIADTSDLIVEGDSRLTDARTPTTHTHAIADVTGLQTALDGRATDAELSSHASDTTSVHGIADTGKLVTADEVRSIVVLTQSEYDGLTPDASTLYVISG